MKKATVYLKIFQQHVVYIKKAVTLMKDLHALY